MPGFDACFKAPKSVSLLWAFGDRIQVGGRTLDNVVEAAHDQAVRAALGYLEAAAAKGRRGRDGVVQVDSSGFVAAVFRQRTSRANDPHLHSHVLVANTCQGGDGRWGAPDARLLYVHAKAAGYLYETPSPLSAEQRPRRGVDRGHQRDRRRGRRPRGDDRPLLEAVEGDP
jgi:conjugative relaxase-like TrwC/TraI family protein